MSRDGNLAGGEQEKLNCLPSLQFFPFPSVYYAKAWLSQLRAWKANTLICAWWVAKRKKKKP